jgi:hypothetical protein
MKPLWTLDTPPIWCQNAIATDRGWLNPDTKILEVASRYLHNIVKYEDAISKPLPVNDVQVTSIPPPVNSIPVVENIKRKPGRPRTKPLVEKIKRPRGRPKLIKNTDTSPIELIHEHSRS